MADTRTEYVPPDPTTIDAGNAEALRYWSNALDTDAEKIRRAVEKVGPVLDQVKTELGIGGVG
jgi:hypothetical protein